MQSYEKRIKKTSYLEGAYIVVGSCSREISVICQLLVMAVIKIECKYRSESGEYCQREWSGENFPGT